MSAAVSPRRHRHLLVLVLAGVLVPILTACADVERTVVDKGFVGEDQQVTWVSDRYPAHASRVLDPECWNAATVGEPVPEACLTAHALALETDPFAASPWIANAATFAGIGLLLLVAWQMVGWQPAVERATSGNPIPRHFDEDGAVALMRDTETERSARVEAERHRRDLPRPFVTGTVVTLLAVMLMALLVGFGRAFGWALTTGVILFIGVGPVTALLQLNLLRPSNIDAAISRASFLCGAAAAMGLGGFVALNSRSPLLNLNGVDWPF